MQYKHKTIVFKDVTATFALDVSAPFNALGRSAFSLHYPDGEIYGIGVPSVLNGIPSYHGITPTMEDLVNIAMLCIEFWPVLVAVGNDGGKDRLTDVARSIGHELPENDDTFEWLQIIREAVEKGFVTADGTLTYPGPARAEPSTLEPHF